jgi:hypothetical protein
MPVRVTPIADLNRRIYAMAEEHGALYRAAIDAYGTPAFTAASAALGAKLYEPLALQDQVVRFHRKPEYFRVHGRSEKY